MIVIDVKKERGLENALKKYKFKVRKIKQNEKLRERQEFVKPSVKKRLKKMKACYREKFKEQED